MSLPTPVELIGWCIHDTGEPRAFFFLIGFSSQSNQANASCNIFFLSQNICLKVNCLNEYPINNRLINNSDLEQCHFSTAYQSHSKKKKKTT